MRYHTSLLSTWDVHMGTQGTSRSSQGTTKHQGPISPCISQMLGPLISLATPAAQEPTPRPGCSKHLAECPCSSQHPPSPLSAAACPAGQVFVNCSDLHTDPELSRERTCEQQLLNLSVPARGPCLSGCACPQG